MPTPITVANTEKKSVPRILRFAVSIEKRSPSCWGQYVEAKLTPFPEGGRDFFAARLRGADRCFKSTILRVWSKPVALIL